MRAWNRLGNCGGRGAFLLAFALAGAGFFATSSRLRADGDDPPPFETPAADPADLQAAASHYRSGLAALRTGNYDQALADFTQVIQIKPHSAKAYALRAGAYACKGERDQALADLSQARLLGPQIVPVHIFSARAYRILGEDGQALAEINQAIQLQPQSAPVCNNLAWFLATCPQAALRNGKKAVEEATKACELTHWQIPAQLDTLAAACAEAGDFDDVVKWETQSLAASDLNSIRRKERLALYQARQPYHADRQAVSW